MANDVRNELIVAGRYSDVMWFVEQVGKTMDFEKIIPSPKNMFKGPLGPKGRKECAKKGVSNWYDWRSKNWGTKSNAYDCEEVVISPFNEPPYPGWFEVTACATYRFNTAWNTPEPVIRKIFEDYPELEVDGGYIGEGYEFCGSFQDFHDHYIEEVA